jgi:poly(3-hydroxybutyrate) depolymerase
MTMHSLRSVVILVAMTTGLATVGLSQSESSSGNTMEETIAPGSNYDKAAFRLWYPPSATFIKAVVVLMPGSNGDGRPMAEDMFWRNFATRHQVALLGCQFTDKPHDQKFIEQYANVSLGSGQALLDALAALAKRSGHAELAQAPLFLWGMSAGGEFNYEFVAWKPERVAAFVVNKGGIYFTALTSRAARSVPGLLFIGGKDLESRKSAIAGLFALNRRGGALWALTEEPSAAHIVGRSRDLGATLFEDVLTLRFDPSNPENSANLKPLSEQAGFIGDRKTKMFQPAAGSQQRTESTVWLPTERVARAWQAVEKEAPFDP